MSELRVLKDVRKGRVTYLDDATGTLYKDPGGKDVLRRMVPTEFLLGDHGRPARDESGRMIHASALANAAAEHYYRKVAEQSGRAVDYEVSDEAGNRFKMTAKPVERLVTTRDMETGRLVTMDLGIADVHTPSALPNYAAGYHITDGIADVVSPVVLVEKQSDVYYTYNSDNDFKRKLAIGSAPGGTVPEVNPILGASTYNALQYALGGFMPTEIQANADTPLRPFTKLTQMIVDGLRLEREIRVATGLQTSGNWNSNLVTTILSGSQWDGGPASDPLLNLHRAIEASYAPVTGIVWSEGVEHDFLRNPNVQKYFTFKDMVNGIPDPQKLSSTLRLPPIHTAMMKYQVGGALQYVWGNHVVLIHQPAQQMPTDQMNVGTALTFRWMGGAAPDGTVTAGLLIRMYYDPKRGARGGTQVVAVHSDTELQTSGLVGGLLLNARQ